MAEPYLTDLRELVDGWMKIEPKVGPVECRHFFSGAAAYRDGAIIATLTPVGLAFKVPATVHDQILGAGRAVPLRYFPNAPIKRNYVVFPDATAIDASEAALLLLGQPLA